MPIGLLFWVLYVLAVILSVYWYGFVPGLVIFILIFLLGWKTFGFVVQG